MVQRIEKLREKRVGTAEWLEDILTMDLLEDILILATDMVR